MIREILKNSDLWKAFVAGMITIHPQKTEKDINETFINDIETSIRKLIPQKKKTTDKEIFIFNHRKGGDKEKISRKWSFRSGYNQAIDDTEKRLG